MTYYLCDKDWRVLYDSGTCKEYILDLVFATVMENTNSHWYKPAFINSGYIHVKVNGSSYIKYLEGTTLAAKIEKLFHYVEDRMGFDKSVVESMGGNVKIKSTNQWTKTPHHTAMYTWFLRISPLFEDTIQSIYDKRAAINTSDFGYLTPACQQFIERVLSGEEFPSNDWRYHGSVHSTGGIQVNAIKYYKNESRVSAA